MLISTRCLPERVNSSAKEQNRTVESKSSWNWKERGREKRKRSKREKRTRTRSRSALDSTLRLCYFFQLLLETLNWCMFQWLHCLPSCSLHSLQYTVHCCTSSTVRFVRLTCTQVHSLLACMPACLRLAFTAKASDTVARTLLLSSSRVDSRAALDSIETGRVMTRLRPGWLDSSGGSLVQSCSVVFSPSLHLTHSSLLVAAASGFASISLRAQQNNILHKGTRFMSQK